MPNYRRYYLAGHPVFVTLVTRQRRPWLGSPDATEMLLAAMRKVRERQPYQHLAHVVMPDHLHWLLHPADGNFSRMVAAVKRDVTWRMKDTAVGQQAFADLGLWQPRFYDHVIRDDDDLARHLDYIHYNPVKHGHAAAPGEWPASSFRAWVERGHYPAEWGARAPDSIRSLELE